ncbi:MAG: alpha/beta hydrolase [Cyanobacteriota bacterium]
MNKVYRIIKNSKTIGKEISCKFIEKNLIIYEFINIRPFRGYGDSYKCILKVDQDSYELKYFNCEITQNGYISNITIQNNNNKIEILNNLKLNFQHKILNIKPGLFLLDHFNYISLFQAIIDYYCSVNRSVIEINTLNVSIDCFDSLIKLSKSNNQKNLVNISGSLNAKVFINGSTFEIEKIIIEDENIEIVKEYEDFNIESKVFEISPAQYIREEVSFRSFDKKLISARAWIPYNKKTKQAILLISGSGANDWSSLGLFSQLLDFLASSGYTVLSYDKRGVNNSEGNFEDITFETLCKDAISAINYLCDSSGFESVCIIGHSEGGNIAPKIAFDSAKVHSLILLAPYTEKYFDFMYSKFKYKAMLLNWSALKLKEKLDNIAFIKRLVLENTDYITLLDQQISLKFIKSIYEYDAGYYISRLECPIYLLHGKKDLTIPFMQSERVLSEESSNITLDLIHNINHSFGYLVNEVESFPYREYYKISFMVEKLILHWLEKNN